MGPKCTPRAVQERLKKLKKDAKAGFGGTVTQSDATGAGVKKPTASKGKAIRKKAPVKAGKKKAAPAAPAAAETWIEPFPDLEIEVEEEPLAPEESPRKVTCTPISILGWPLYADGIAEAQVQAQQLCR